MQVAMLSGRHPGSSSGTPYVSNYEVLQRDNSMMRPGPFATQRIQHSQRINPKLIIKELDIVIEKIVGESAGWLRAVGAWAERKGKGLVLDAGG